MLILDSAGQEDDAMAKQWAVVIVAACVAVTAVAVASAAGKVKVVGAGIADKEGKLRVAFGIGDGSVAVTLEDKDGNLCVHTEQSAGVPAGPACAVSEEQTNGHSG
jgi:hypothetical protein